MRSGYSKEHSWLSRQVPQQILRLLEWSLSTSRFSRPSAGHAWISIACCCYSGQRPQGNTNHIQPQEPVALDLPYWLVCFSTLQEPRCTRDSQLQGFHGHQCTWTTIRYDGPIVLQYTTTYTPSTSKYYVAGPCPFFLHLSTAMLNYSISTVDSKWVEHTWAAALFLLNFRGKWDWFCMGRGKEGKRSVHLCILRVLRSWSVTA